MANLQSLTVNDTGNLTLPSGLTATRPSATTTVSSFTTTGSTTWTCPANVTSIEVLVVAGGGGGGSGDGGGGMGGGGGGGVVYNSNYPVTPGTVYTVTVGAGGSGAVWSGTVAATPGGNSVFDSITAYGGGIGSNATSPTTYQSGGNGGSGGGGSGGYHPGAGTTGYLGIAGGAGGLGIYGQGHNGGAGGNTSTTGGNGYKGGGGGGAGSPGMSAQELSSNGGPYNTANAAGFASVYGCNGGNGVQYNISGTPTYYGGGGGGGVIWSSWYNAFTGGIGGLGGGGNGGSHTASAGTGTVGIAGTANTGGGGGGAAYQAANGGAGGSGIVIIKYALSATNTNPQGATRLNSTYGTPLLESYVSTSWKTITDPIVTNGLMMYVDGSKYTSGTTWYDLSGNGNNVTLTGTPTYNTANGGYLTFDGSTQYGVAGSITSASGFLQYTVELWINPTTLTNYGGPFDANYNYVGTGANSNIGPRFETNAAGKFNTVLGDNSTTVNSNYSAYEITGYPYSYLSTDSTFGTFQAGQWYHVVMTRNAAGQVSTFYNGTPIEVNKPHGFTHSNTFTNVNIGRGFALGSTGRYWNGSIASVKIYNRGLTRDEVIQNYNASASKFNIMPIDASTSVNAGAAGNIPAIVTAGLNLHLDAGNPASYPGYGPYWYDISTQANGGQQYIGNFQGVGPSFDPQCGGSLYFWNSANLCCVDLNTTSIISGTTPHTIEIWYNNVGANTGELFGNYGPSNNFLWTFSGGSWYTGGNGYVPNYASKITGKHHLVMSRDQSGVINVWLDGYREVIDVVSTASVTGGQNFRIGSDVNNTNGEQFVGWIYSVRVYNRPLTPAEIMQNFQATRNRYGV